MKSEHQALVNAKFLDLVIQEVKKNHPEKDVDGINKDFLMEQIENGANLATLKILATRILIDQKSRPKSRPDLL